MKGEKIEIPSVELLDCQRDIVDAFWRVSRSTRVEPGWHYLLDLSWAVSSLGPISGKRILDAGAGMGLMQWYLSVHGATAVISADRDSRRDLPLVMRSRYRVCGLRSSDLAPAWDVLKGNVGRASGAGKAIYALRGLVAMVLIALPKRYSGQVFIYNQNLASLPDIPDDSLDAVVAISALEHNTPEGLRKVVVELMRKLKPGGKLVATLCAAKGKDWFHEPSKGWCYTDATLRRLFSLSRDVPSNFTEYNRLFERLRNCAELRHHLAKIYFLSGDNGMPWGIWDPQYQPVGVVKIKAES